MLVLSRRENEQLIIGDITITICRIRNGAVKIGIEAPRYVPIIRAELEDDYGRDRDCDERAGE